MTTTTTEQAAAADQKIDRWAHAITVAGGIIHDVGAMLLKKRNEQLAEAIADAHNQVTLLARLVEHGYHMGRAHQLAGVPVPADIPQAAAEDLARMAMDHHAPPPGAEHQVDDVGPGPFARSDEHRRLVDDIEAHGFPGADVDDDVSTAAAPK